jgi:hypothetical protein
MRFHESDKLTFGEKSRIAMLKSGGEPWEKVEELLKSYGYYGVRLEACKNFYESLKNGGGEKDAKTI